MKLEISEDGRQASLDAHRWVDVIEDLRAGTIGLEEFASLTGDLPWLGSNLDLAAERAALVAALCRPVTADDIRAELRRRADFAREAAERLGSGVAGLAEIGYNGLALSPE